MSGTEQSTNNTVWYSIIEGKFHQKVDKDTDGAVMREWSTPDGKSGVKYELVFNALFGLIEDIRIEDSEYGKQIKIYLDKDENGRTPVIVTSADSKYGVDFLKKLPNVKLEQEVRFLPFDFENDDGQRVIGLRLEHKDSDGKYTVKLGNYFYDGGKSINGFPVPPENARDTWDKKDWKNYFEYTVVKFLIGYTIENVLPKLKTKPSSSVLPEYPEEEINPDDIPF